MKRSMKRLSIPALLLVAAQAALADPQGVTDDNLPLFYQALKERMSFPLAYEGGDPAVWREQTLPQVRASILPYTASRPFEAELIDEVDRGSYLARRIAFNVSDESRVTALLLVPKGEGPFPAALMLHDHGSRFDIGKEKWIAPWYDDQRLESANEWADRFFSGRFPGEELAERGYVVLATDALGWGDREGNGYEAQQALAANLFNLGSSLAGLIALEDTRAAAFLAELPDTDPDRIAAVGFSMGAFRAWQVAALSPHISATVANAWMAQAKGLMVPGNNQLRGQSAFNMLHPSLLRLLDFPDVAALAAPAPMLVYAGEEDTLFPPSAVEGAMARMHDVWSAHGAEEHLTTRLWEDKGHVFTADMQDAAFEWLDAKLR